MVQVSSKIWSVGLSNRDNKVVEGQNIVTMNHLDLASCSVIGELPLFIALVTANDKIRAVTDWFDRDPDLPGVIVKDRQSHLLLSREKLFEWLSKPFGTELFLNRPISFLISSTSSTGLLLKADTRIDEAVQIVLGRATLEKYEPIIVELENGDLRVLDFHILLLAQTQLLAQANQFVNQQVESGRALSQIMELPEVLNHILRYLSSLIDFDQGSILIMDPLLMNYSKQSLKIVKPTNISSQLIDIVNDQKASNYLYHSRQPLLITDVAYAQEWLDTTADYKHVVSWIGFPLVYADKTICLISLTRLAGQQASTPFSRFDLDLIASLSSTFTSAIRNAHLHAELRVLAVTDPLTGALNRRGFFETAQKSFDRCTNLGNACSVLVLDIDFFKRVNDTFGHRIGDLVIRTIAEESRRQLREIDLLGRYGGEEFVVFLPGANLASAESVAERLREAIAHLPVQTGLGATSITVSIGITASQSGSTTLDELIQQADEAMYLAKSLGRNRSEIWEGSSIYPMMPGRTAPPDRPHSGMLEVQATFEKMAEFDPGKTPTARTIEEIETESILGWVRALELRGNGEEHHGQESANLTVRLCRRLGFSESELVHIYRGAILHDVGKLAIPDSILNKKGPLDEAEWEIMRRHAEFGFRMLLPITFLHPALTIPYCHHEKWDGSGYPRGLSGEMIPLESRMFALVDVWQALCSNRCYRKAWTEDRVAAYIRSESGKHFDPGLVELFLEAVTE